MYVHVYTFMYNYNGNETYNTTQQCYIQSINTSQGMKRKKTFCEIFHYKNTKNRKFILNSSPLPNSGSWGRLKPIPQSTKQGPPWRRRLSPAHSHTKGIRKLLPLPCTLSFGSRPPMILY